MKGREAPGVLYFLLGCSSGLLAIQAAASGPALVASFTAVAIAAGLAFSASMVFGLSSAILGRFPGHRGAFVLGLACPVVSALAGWSLAYDNHPPEQVFGLSLLLFFLLPALAPMAARRQPPPAR